MLRHLFLLGFTILLVSYTQAQDPVFSQFFATPMQLNPAFAGTTYAPRITLNYRNQWPSWPNAYTTYAASYEQSIEGLNSGFGIVLMTDNAGDGIYKTNRFSAVYGYKLQMTNDLFMKMGVEAGLIQSTVDWDRLLFGDQLDPLNGSVDPSGNPYQSEEVPPETLNRTMLDIAAGILIYSKNYYAGLAVKHLNSPDESILDINQNLRAGLPLRMTLQAGAEFTIQRGNNRRAPTFISPNLLLIRQGDFGQINVGAYAGFGKFFGGLWYRHTFSNPDAAIALVGYREGIFRIGYSYDLTVSGLASVRGGTGGTHEISITINFDDSNKLKRRRHSSRYQDCFKMFN